MPTSSREDFVNGLLRVAAFICHSSQLGWEVKMHKIKNSILASGLTIALAGCVGMEKDMAAEMTPAGSAFNQALYGESDPISLDTELA